jgi:hypothetical protein
VRRALAIGLGGAALAAALAAPRAATAATCEAEAAELRALLTGEARRARRWNTAWAIGFGAASAAQLALGLAETNPLGAFDRDFEDTVYVGAAKAAIGMAVRIALPLRATVPPPAAAPCADLPALRAALADAGRRQRRSFWLTHVGGAALHLAGVALLTHRRSLRTGALSVVLGYPFGLLHAYTQPRRGWHGWRDRRASWTVGVSGASGAGATIWLGGRF